MRIPTFLASVLAISAALTAQVKPCQFTRIAPTCGPVLTGKDIVLGTTTQIFHSFTFVVTKAPSNAPGLLAFSMKQAKLPLGKCTLLLDPTALLLLPFQANTAGTAQVRFTVKGRLKGTIYSQAAHGSPTPVLSNGQKVTCQ